MAKASDFFALVEDVALDLHIPHDAQFSEMREEVLAGDCRLERDGFLLQEIVFRFSLNGAGSTSSILASVWTLKALRVLLNKRIMIINQ